MTNKQKWVASIAIVGVFAFAFMALPSTPHEVGGVAIAMLINAANLDALRAGFKTEFQAGLGLAGSSYPSITTVVPASTKEVKYGWLKNIPGVSEWIGPRTIHNLSQGDYTIKEKAFELTIGVDRDDIETDNLGIYSPMFQMMGESTGVKWDELAWGQLPLGFTTDCFDGQFYFDTDHPITAADGSATVFANTDGGSGTPWFLACTSRVLKPVILQRRKDFEFVAKDDPKDDRVFMNKEFVYGSDARGNVGYTFPQLCWGSKQTLDATHYKAALAALEGMKGDEGRPLGLKGFTLLVPPSLREEGQKLVISENDAAGASNPWKGTAALSVVPWLS
jgi:phage major head subunit gpT-like protein